MHTLEKNSIEQFNSWAKYYDKLLHLPFYLSNKSVVQHLNPKVNSYILDVGCGTGILLQQLLRLDRNLYLYGIDISPEMVKISKKKFDKQPVEIIEGSASKLPYKDCSFDYVCCATSFHHYPTPEKSLEEIFRVLKPGGKLVLLDPFNTGTSRKIICKILTFIFKEGDVNIFSKVQMNKMFLKAGFQKVQQKTFWYYRLMTSGQK